MVVPRGKYNTPRLKKDWPRCKAEHAHQSKKERDRCDELHLMVKGRLIANLMTQQRFRLEVNSQKICDYIADFTYNDMKGGYTVEDSKGKITDVFKLKKKLMRACLGIDIKQT